MRKFYLILCCVLALLLLTVGGISLFDKDATASEIEERELLSFPKLTVSGILKGTFLEELENYYADTFPARDYLLEGDWIVDKFFDFSDLTLEVQE